MGQDPRPCRRPEVDPDAFTAAPTYGDLAVQPHLAKE